MLQTFNCGVGMILTVNGSDAEEVMTLLTSGGEPHIYDMDILVKGEEVESLIFMTWVF